MSYTSSDEEQQQLGYSYNNNSSHLISGDPRIRVRRPEYDIEPRRTTLTQEQQLEILTENPLAREIAFQNVNRKCRFCNSPIPGEANEYHSPQDEHVRSGECEEWNKMKKVRESSEKAHEAIQSAQRAMEFAVSKQREAQRKIEEEILTLLSLNAAHGSSLPCSSIEEWNQRYDYGRKDATKVSVTSLIGNGYRQQGKNEKLMVRDYSIDKSGQMFYSPANITRIVDDFLNQMRQEHPDVMSSIDAKLGQANRRLTAQQ
jgi:hypothetical protein